MNDSMSSIVARKLRRLAKEAELGELSGVLDRINWKAGMRFRLVLELDVHQNAVEVHGYEFRYRKPNSP